MAKKKPRKPSATDPAEGTLTRVEELESTEAGIVKRWLAELTIADQVEQDWRKEASEAWERYKNENARAASFNILWPNTEILSAAIYNSTPQPDVRRRFRDDDPVGKAVATLLERSLSYAVDDYDFDGEISDAVLDLLVPGRGIARVKYTPKFEQVDSPPTEDELQDGEQPAEGPHERVVEQHVECEHVQWDDFRRGPGKRWRDVPWIAFRHEFTFDMAVEAFGEEIARELKYEQGKDTERASEDRQVRAVFKVCEVWEIWDKDKRRVLFIAPTYHKRPCKVVDDPLKLKGFWPCPRPMYAVRTSHQLEPIPIFRLYKEQAAELDRISGRIAVTVRALRMRGAYNAAMTELGQIIDADDASMIPIENAAAVADSGGLDKNIWLMPVDRLINVLRGLYEAREQIKSTIYEIIGIADILRGASNPNETASAQQIKSRWGSVRVQKLQREVARFVRDLMRLKAEVIAEQFTQQQFAATTNIQLPTAQEQEAAKMQAALLQREGQPIPEDIKRALSTPTWETVLEVMRSDMLRCYRVDVETDSTVAETIERDMVGLGELLQSLSGWVQGAFMAVQAGAMSMETLKQIALAVIRRARLGRAVEDAFEQLQEPQPQQPDQGEQLQAMRDQLLEIIKSEGVRLTQAEQGIAQRNQEIDAVIQQLGQGAQAASAHAIEAHQTAQQERHALNSLVGVMQQLMQGLRSVQEALTAPKVVSFDRGPDRRIIGARATTANVSPQPTPIESQMIQTMGAIASTLSRLETAISAPKRVQFIRDENGRISGATAGV